MKLIVCMDDRCGVLFNNRRVSSDREVVKHILEAIGREKLYCSQYSSELFPEDRVCVVDSPADLQSDAHCFWEGQDLTAIADQVRELVVYKWNRRYPYDCAFPVELFENKLACIAKEEFAGSSHDRITCEVYRK